jgi:WD40 repeat protein
VLRRFGTVRFRSDDWNTIAALSPDAKFLVTESTEHFTVFDLKSRKPRLRLRPSGVSGEDDVPWPRIGGFSSDGKILATVVRDGSLRLWDLTTGKECLRLSRDKGFHFNNIHFPVADHAILLNMTKKPDEIPPTHSLSRILDYKRRVLHEWTLNGELAGLSADKKG